MSEKQNPEDPSNELVIDLADDKARGALMCPLCGEVVLIDGNVQLECRNGHPPARLRRPSGSGGAA
jgi:hypothetical protein